MEKEKRMSRYIDVDKLLDVNRIKYSPFFDFFKAIVDEQPTVDVEEVIRCRDCKHFRHCGKTSLIVNGKNVKAGWCQRRIRYNEEYRMLSDDFCSYGERKVQE